MCKVINILGTLHGVCWCLVADVSEQRIGPILKGQLIRESRSNLTYSFMQVRGLLSQYNDQATFWFAGKLWFDSRWGYKCLVKHSDSFISLLAVSSYEYVIDAGRLTEKYWEYVTSVTRKDVETVGIRKFHNEELYYLYSFIFTEWNAWDVSYVGKWEMHRNCRKTWWGFLGDGGVTGVMRVIHHYVIQRDGVTWRRHGSDGAICRCPPPPSPFTEAQILRKYTLRIV